MTNTSAKGPTIDPGLCRCCGFIKKCRLLNVEYIWVGQREVYSEMFVDCFGLMLSHLDGEEVDRVICATCVVRLRDACAFRHQVLQCEEKLLHAKIQVHGDDTANKLETIVKSEFEDEPQQGTEEGNEEGKEVNTQELPAEDLDELGEPLDNDTDSTKSEPLSKLLKKSPKKKKTKKLSKRKANGDKIKENKKRKKKKVEDIQHMLPTPRVTKKVIDSEIQSLANAIAIVENSFVCPFENSFSDYYCIYCRESFSDPNKLKEHTLSHDPTTYKDKIVNKKLLLVDISKIDCRLCHITIDDIDILKSHLINTHQIELYQISNEFLKFRLTANNLTCTECNASFSFFHALKKHMAEHFGTCICDICGAHYFEERMLNLHQKTHQKIDESFSCNECGKVFKSKHTRNLHEAKLHKKEPAYECYKCDAVLFSYSLRYRHMIDVHGEQRMFSCDNCDRVYDSRKSLREHNRRYHLKVFKHQCDLCDKRFYLPSRLKEHLATHTGERNFRCEYCGKSYPRLRGLKVHMQSHSSDKKYRCNMCNATFTQNINLKNHVKRQHQILETEYPVL